MHLGMNISNALQQLESVKAAVDQSDDPKLKAAANDDLNMLINLLESPILKSIATLHDSVGMLATQVAHHPSIIPGDFDITPAGDLALQTRNLYGGHEGEEEQRVPQVSPPHSLEFGSSSDNERILGLDSGSVDSNMSPKQNRGLLDLSRNDDSLASGSNNIVASDWAQVEIINLVNDGTGLGFGIIGARTSGVIVKTILAGGVADRDGRLKSGDHILQIGDAHLMEMGSEQVAGVLRASGSRVRLVVARAADPAAPPLHNHSAHPAPLVPARLLSDPEALDRYLLEAGFEQVFHTQPTPVAHSANASRFIFDRSITPPVETEAESPEVDRFTVQLKKDENGLGITIAGYVCEKEELSGIFVKSVTPGSAAALSGKVRVNDRIVAVDGVSLAGKSNQRAVDALKQSGNVVTLELERYLRGPKFEQLQQAIAAGESAASTVPPHNPFLHMHRPDSVTSPEHDIQMTHLQNSVSVESAVEEVVSTSPPPPTITRSHPPFEMPRTQEQKDVIKRKWQAILGDEVEIVVGVVVRGGGGLGISLEGTVDVEGGARGAPAPLRALRAARGARGPRRRAPPWGRAAGYVVTYRARWTWREGARCARTTTCAPCCPRGPWAAPACTALGTSCWVRGYLQGTVDVEGGREVRPHHYVRSVLPEGPVGRAGVHRPGDELLGTWLLTGHGGRGGRARGAPAPLRALRAARGARGPRRRAPPWGRAAGYVVTYRARWTWREGARCARTTTCAPCCPRGPWAAPACTALGTSCWVRGYLQGTVDVEGGREVRPHHYVRSVLPEGPVGRAGVHRPGDELLEVNGHRLLGMNHLEVVSILKELSSEVCMVCARPRPAPPLDLAPPSATLVKAKSDGSLAGAGAEEGGSLSAGGKVRSRSLEPLTGLAMWSSEPQIIELVKGERGLGFSILDYQDPLRPSHTLVVIRSLVPGGVAQQDGRLIPGDRLLFVNDQNLEDASLEQAVAALKGAARGVVRIGVAKPLPLADAPPPLPATAPPALP
ncbi:unnamed protein product [Arctia plantaginis]|uniref:Patj homolog n=1 Tax=Arctia plantaginis TaxID=874455 RepID=A0A8S0ZZH6_ARCPL|nr:unnamed protein product [Arctia plantaginis]